MTSCNIVKKLFLKRDAVHANSPSNKATIDCTLSELAQTVVDAGAIAHLAHLTLNPDSKLKRQVFSALSQISKHSVELAEMVVEAEIFPNILTCLKDTDEYVKKNCATLIREIAKHTPEVNILKFGVILIILSCRIQLFDCCVRARKHEKAIFVSI